MSPALPGLYSANGVLKNAIFSRYFSLQPIIRTYCGNLRACKLRCSAAFATICRSMSNLVCMICAGSIPSEISTSIIRTLSVIVAAFHSRWSRANKGKQYQRTHTDAFRFVFSPQQKGKTAIKFVCCRALDFAGFESANATKIGHFIFFKTRYSAPLFHSYWCGIKPYSGQV